MCVWKLSSTYIMWELNKLISINRQPSNLAEIKHTANQQDDDNKYKMSHREWSQAPQSLELSGRHDGMTQPRRPYRRVWLTGPLARRGVSTPGRWRTPRLSLASTPALTFALFHIKKKRRLPLKGFILAGDVPKKHAWACVSSQSSVSQSSRLYFLVVVIVNWCYDKLYTVRVTLYTHTHTQTTPWRARIQPVYDCWYCDYVRSMCIPT